MRECYLTLSLKYLHQNQGVHQADSVWLEGFSEAFQDSLFSSLHLSYRVKDTHLQDTEISAHIVLFQQCNIALKGQKSTILWQAQEQLWPSLSHPLQQEGSNTSSRAVLPSFHFGEVNCYESIWKCFFIQVSAVSPNEGRHIIA